MTTERRGAARLLRNVALVDHPLPFHANRAFERADSVALAVLGQPSSKSHRGLRWGRHGSISMRLRGDKRGFWHDFERGEGGDVLDLIARQHDVGVGEAIRIARRDYLSVSELRMAPRWPPPCARPAAADDAEGRIKAALRIWGETVPLAGTLAERYFERRTLDAKLLDLDHAVRWHAGIRAIVALMTNPVSAEPIGIHRTFLDAGGAKIERKMLGRQGVVRLSPHDEVTIGLGVTEGLEDGLAVMLSGWLPIWTATSASAIARFPVLVGIDALTIFTDADTAGQLAAEKCAEHWVAQGRDVRIAAPGRRT